MGNSQNKSFRTEHGNGLDLHPGSMGASSGGAIGELKSGNVRSHKEAALDIVISGVSGAVAGAVGAKPSGSKAFDEFLEGAAARFLNTFRNPNMSMTDRLKCTFDIKAMSLDIMAGSIGGSDSQGIRADFGRECGKNPGKTTRKRDA